VDGKEKVVWCENGHYYVAKLERYGKWVVYGLGLIQPKYFANISPPDFDPK
jgi:hypothetical protein